MFGLKGVDPESSKVFVDSIQVMPVVASARHRQLSPWACAVDFNQRLECSGGSFSGGSINRCFVGRLLHGLLQSSELTNGC
jgi:hypothetical protein